MSSSRELDEELLPATDSASVEAAIHHLPRSQAAVEAVRRKACPPSFSDGYVPIDGVPAKVFKPSAAESRFTCHAFSDDKCRFATGESNGTVRQWTAVGCPTVTDEFIRSGISIQHLAFSSEYHDGVYAADDSGTVKCISFGDEEVAEFIAAREPENWAPTEGEVASRMDAICRDSDVDSSQCSYRQQRALRLSGAGHTAAVSVMAWDERMKTKKCLLWSKVYGFHRGNREWRCLVDLSGSFDRPGPSRPTLAERRAFSKKFSLSKNGYGLIAASHEGHNAIVVYPSLHTDDPDLAVCVVSNASATWGLSGEYLVLWKLFGDQSVIAVCETKRLGSRFEDWSALAKRSLGPGVKELEVRMLDDSASFNRLEILVAEIHESSETRIYLWDAEKNTLKVEVHLPVGPQLNILSELEADAETDIAASASDYLFCISKDRKWIGTLCTNLCTCSLLSVVSGAVVNQIQISAGDMAKKTWTFSDVTFDASERHLLLFSEEVVLALAPAALNTDSLLNPRTVRWKDMSVNSGIPSNPTPAFTRDRLRATIELFSAFSPEAFDFAATMPSDVFLFDSYTGQPRRSVYSASQKTIGAGYSAECDFVAFIVGCINLSDVKVLIWHLTSDDVLVPQNFAGLNFPLEFDAGEAGSGFSPAKLVFYRTDDAKEKMILLPADYRPAIMFCQLPEESWEVVSLQMEKCLAFRRAEDKKRMCLLDVSSVCFLDLQLRTIVFRIRYKVNFCKLMATAGEAQCGDSNWKHYLKNCQNKLLASDGQTVLLAWDMTHACSIVVTPGTQQQQCVKLIGEAGSDITFSCGISGNSKYGHSWTKSTHSDDRSKQFCVISIPGDGAYRIELPMDVEQRLCLDLSANGSVATVLLVTKNRDVQEAALCQFSLYCTEELAPSKKLLQLREPNTLSALAAETVEEFGISAVTSSYTAEKTVAQKAILQDAKEVVDMVRKKCRGRKDKVWLDWTSKDGQVRNLLDEAVKGNSTKSVQHIMELMRDGLTPFNSTAVYMKQRWRVLCLPEFRKILSTALSENSFVFDACEVMVHIGFLDSSLRKQRAVHINTTDSFLEWSVCRDPGALKVKWRRANKKAAAKMEKDGDKSTTEALLRFISIEDAAKTGMRGILRPLLLQQVPAHFFKHDAVKWVIQYKWHKIWQQRFLKSSIQYGIFLICFTSYVVLVGYTEDLSHDHQWVRIVSTTLVGVNFFWGSIWLNEETRQVRTFAADGEQHLENSWLGVQYYFTSTWNLIDLVSCAFLIVFIPVFHMVEVSGSGWGKVLSTFIAFETILAYIKVWYFAQPFRKTGAQVLMIQSIIEDSFYFLVLAFFVLCGFALGLRTVLRHPPFKAEDNPTVLRSTNATGAPYNVSLSGDSDLVKDYFGTPWSSLETLFYALLGEFEPEIYHSSGGRSWVVSALFNIYLICLVIILLNLLISTMGDTFDRVKSTEADQLLLGKARIIDACEASLTESERDEIDKKVKNYVRVVVDPDNVDEEGPPDEWMGKLTAIDRGLRSRIRESETATRSELRALESRTMQIVRNELQAVRGELQDQESRMIRAVRDELQAQEERVIEHNHRLEQKLAEQTSQLESRLAALNEDTANRMDRLLELLIRETRQAAGRQSAPSSQPAD